MSLAPKLHLYLAPNWNQLEWDNLLDSLYCMIQLDWAALSESMALCAYPL